MRREAGGQLGRLHEPFQKLEQALLGDSSGSIAGTGGSLDDFGNGGSLDDFADW